MKKNRLYTVNKYNRPAFMPQNDQRENLYGFGSSFMQAAGLGNLKEMFSANGIGNSLGQFVGNLLGTSSYEGASANPENPEEKPAGDAMTQATSPSGATGQDIISNAFAGSALRIGQGKAYGGPLGNRYDGGGLLGGISGGLASAVGGAIGGAISNGYSSTAGDIVDKVGDVVGAIPGFGTIAGAGLKILSGGINALFGTKVNQAKLQAANKGTNAYNSFTSNAGTFDDIKMAQAQEGVQDAYSSGLFNKGWAAERNKRLHDQRIDARQFASRSVANNISNIQNNQINDALANFSAFGGPLGGAAIDHDLMSDLLRTKEKNSEKNNIMTNPFANTPSTMFAIGGDLQTHGGDWGSGLTHINAGQSHELNPNDGVQMGVDPEGKPNLVEEGETVYNDYVFSNRIYADESTKRIFRLPKKKDVTFADISKKLEKEIAERPNDPVSKAGFKAQMQQLEEQQERQKQEMEAERAKAAFEALSPEEQTALMQQRAEQEAMAQQAAEQQAMAEQQAAMQPSPEEAAMMQQQADGTQAMVGQQPQEMAEGGNLYSGKQEGSSKMQKRNAGTWKSGDSSSNWAAYTKNGLRDYLLMINDELANAETDADKKAIREKAIKTVNDIQKAYSEAYQANLTPSEKNEKVEALQKAFQEAGGNAYFSNIANNINLPKGHNTTDTEEKGWVDGYWGPRTSIRNWGSTEYGDSDYYKDLSDLAAEAGLSYAPGDLKYGDHSLYQLSMAPVAGNEQEPEIEWAADFGDNSSTPDTKAATKSAKEEVESNIEPVKNYEGLRYVGLAGPAVGLGLMAAGVGKPDYSGLYGAEATASASPARAGYRPIGNYLTYRPMDIWYQQNALNAQSRATDRALANSSSPSKAAGLLANGYNSQLASGNLYRQALEYNDAQRQKVEDFNRGTNMFNAEAYNKTSMFNADAENRARQFAAQMQMHGATERLNRDASWYNSLYGNIGQLFKGISDLGRENKEANWRNALATAGAFGVLDEDALVRAGYAKYKDKKKSSNGGSIKVKKHKKGLTY